MEMGGNFCQILELGGTTIKGRRVARQNSPIEISLQTIIQTNKQTNMMFYTFADRKCSGPFCTSISA